MLDVIPCGEPALSELRTLPGCAEDSELKPLDTAEVEVMAPIPRPPKIVAVGLNYMDHCRETGSEPPRRPLLFAKYPS